LAPKPSISALKFLEPGSMEMEKRILEVECFYGLTELFSQAEFIEGEK
jgi:hypothetical protein